MLETWNFFCPRILLSLTEKFHTSLHAVVSIIDERHKQSDNNH